MKLDNQSRVKDHVLSILCNYYYFFLVFVMCYDYNIINHKLYCDTFGHVSICWCSPALKDNLFYVCVEKDH